MYTATVSLSTMAENPIDYLPNTTTMVTAEEADPIAATTPPTAATVGTTSFSASLADKDQSLSSEVDSSSSASVLEECYKYNSKSDFIESGDHIMGKDGCYFL